MKHVFTLFLSIILFSANPMSVLAQEAYAVVSPDSTTLTFYYDKNKSSRQGTAYELDEYPEWINMEVLMGSSWEPSSVVFDRRFLKYSFGYGGKNPTFTTVVFDKSFKNARPKSCNLWFAGFKNLIKIEGLENLNTSKVVGMSCMFKGCSNLRNLDLSGFNTSNVTDMSSMFYGCESLTNLDLSCFDTSNVTDMRGMFKDCYGLTTVDVSKFNTAKVTDMRCMFYDCRSLKDLDVSKFNTAKVTNMILMFSGCRNLTNLDVSNFNTSNVTNIEGMFYDCRRLTNLDVKWV